MSASPLHQVPNIGSTFDFSSDHHRREDLLSRDPCRIGPFIRVARRLAARHLTPAFSTIGVFNTDEDNAAFVSTAKAGLKKMNEREVDLNEFDRLYLHYLNGKR